MVTSLRATAIPASERGADAFVIIESQAGGPRHVSIPPDLATCAECAEEVADPVNRRYRYAFTNCTNCGPRLTIARGVPYDRALTTMAPFPMCARCQAEYDDPVNRRFHAQPNACPECGPRLRALTPAGRPVPGDPLRAAADALRRGEVVAVKGIGGFHLACDATSGPAVRLLRARKGREEKPFAVMVRDLAAADAMAELSDAEAALLTATERPIVLLRRRADSPLAPEVAPGSPLVGLMLPYTPLHLLLLREAAHALVMTSGNPSEEPMVTGNDEALDRLTTLADLFLVHDREIETRCDDSVARVIAGRPVLLRRSRGYVPRAVRLARPVVAPILACGGHLKNTFCLAEGTDAWMGPHVGDLETMESLRSFDGGGRADGTVPGHRTRSDRARPPPRLRLERVRASAPGSAQGRRAAPPRPRGGGHGRARPRGPRDRRGLRRDGLRHGRDGLGRRAAAGRLRRIPAARDLPAPALFPAARRAIREIWRIALALLDDAFEGDAPLDRFPVFAG